MAIARGAGTEIIRAHHFAIVDSTTENLIVGEQHHIYTVLSVITFANSVQADGNWIQLRITGYDAKVGTTNIDHVIFRQDMSANQTNIWNDKFSFNGHEPTDFTGPMDDTTKMNAIADQGNASVATKLRMVTEHASDDFDVTCTFVDQNNA